MNPAWILVPLIATLAGWLAGRGAVWIIFHPYQPKKIFGYTLQGFLPARQHELAVKLGKLISTELVSAGGIEQKIADPANFSRIMPLIEQQVDAFLRVKLVEKMPMIGMLIGEKTVLELKTIFIGELEELFPVVMQQYLATLSNDTGLEQAIEQKIATLSLLSWEKRIQKLLSKELFTLQLTGALFGLMVGLLQLFALWLL